MCIRDRITNVVEIVKTRVNPNLNIGGIVITQFDKRKTLNKSVAELINESFCDKVFKTVSRDNVACLLYTSGSFQNGTEAR